MSIIKNEIPILEFDTEQTAVISPVHENLNLVLPKNAQITLDDNMELRLTPSEHISTTDYYEYYNY